MKGKEDAYYDALKRHTDEQVTALESQSKNEQETVEIDGEEAGRVAELASKGVATLNRLSDVRRSCASVIHAPSADQCFA